MLGDAKDGKMDTWGIWIATSHTPTSRDFLLCPFCMKQMGDLISKHVNAEALSLGTLSWLKMGI